jgi:hypothetical protein
MKRKILLGSFLLMAAALISIGTTTSTAGQASAGKACEERLIAVMNPAIATKMAERIPLGPRLNALEGKTIYMYDTQWGGPDAAGSVYEEMQAWFAKNMPSVKTQVYKGTGWMSDDKAFVKKVAENKVDGVILGIAG